MSAGAGEITRLLHLWQAGDPAAESGLFQLLLPDLRRIARRYFRRERAGHTLQPTALVNETFLRLSAAKDLEWQDRAHFLAVAATIMRRYLVDYARARSARAVPVDELAERTPARCDQTELAIQVDALLDELEQQSPRRRSIVEMKFFLGLTDQEAASALNVTLHTFQREWYRARRYLFERLNSKPCNPAARAASGS